MIKTLYFNSLLIHGGLEAGPAGATLKGEVLDRATHVSTPVAAGDVIEFIYFMGGGC